MSDRTNEIESRPTGLPAYLELVRLPNLFTAMADILLGFLFTHQSLEPQAVFDALMLSSCLLYMSGMALNDYFDRRVDAAERPERPIPSGRVPAGAAAALGFGMLAAGVAFGWAATGVSGQIRCGEIATVLAGCVLLYNIALKRTMLGPLVLGLCRMLNVLLGMSASAAPLENVHLAVAGAIGIYILGVSMFARGEAQHGSRPVLAGAVVVMLLGITLLARYPNWADPAQPISVPRQWYLVWVLIGGLILWRCVWAIIDPRPAVVQYAVKNCLISVILLDAAASLPVAGQLWALLIFMLMLPARFLGRWLYST